MQNKPNKTVKRPPAGYIDFHPDKIAKVLEMSPGDIYELFTDGRRASFIIERRITKEILQGIPNPVKCQDFDCKDFQGRKWEIRCLTTSSGVHFGSSASSNGTRKKTPDRETLVKKLVSIHGFAVADLGQFPKVPVYLIETTDILTAYHLGILRTRFFISREAFLDFFAL